MIKYILTKCAQFTVLQNKSFLRNIGILLLYVALSGQIDAQTLKTYKGRMSERPVERIDFGINLGMSLRPEIWSYQYYTPVRDKIRTNKAVLTLLHTPP